MLDLLGSFLTELINSSNFFFNKLFSLSFLKNKKHSHLSWGCFFQFDNNLLTSFSRQRITENGHIFASLIQTN